MLILPRKTDSKTTKLAAILVQMTVLIGTIGCLSASLFYLGILRTNYPSRDRFPIQGIDVSNHQGKIDWQQVKKQGVDFAYMKATEGGDFQDSYFINNWQGAGKASIARGAYHFFTFCKSGKEQAKNFMQTVPKTKGMLPPVVDVEFGGNCRLRSTKSGVVNELEQFTETIEKHYNQRAIIYTTQEAYSAFIANNFNRNPIWIRDIWMEPTLEDSRKWTFWQYANRGAIAGINGFVDLNVFQGDRTQFQQRLAD